MFEGIGDAVRVYRRAGAEHREAVAAGDHVGMRVAGERLREVAAYLRGRDHAELVQPLTMEWVTRGRDAAAHARHAAEVDRVVAAATRPGGPAQL